MTSTRIVLVEDDTSLLAAMASRLRADFDVEVLTFAQGRQSLTPLDDGPVALYCVDLVLPDISGFEVCTRVREHERGAKVPILVVSGRVGLEEKSRVHEVGGSAFMEKPFALKAFAKRVGQFLEVKP